MGSALRRPYTPWRRRVSEPMPLSTPPSVLLREAARLVHLGHHKTLCGALSELLPSDDLGSSLWWSIKSQYLGYCLPVKANGDSAPWDRQWGWWGSRKARVIGGLLAAAMAEVHHEDHSV